MKIEVNKKTLQAISTIYNTSKEKKFEASIFNKLESELHLLSVNLRITPVEAYLFSIIFTQFIEDEMVDYTSIGNHLKCNVIDILAQSETFSNLKRQFLIEAKMTTGKFSKRRESYIIPDIVKEYILEDKFPIPKPNNTVESAIEVLEKCFDLADQSEDKEINEYECVGRIRYYLESYSNFKFIKEILNLKLSSMEQAILVYMLWISISGDEAISMSRLLNIFEYRSVLKIRKSQEFISGKNILISSNLLELDKANFFNDSRLRLGKKGLKLLEDEGIKISENDKRDLIVHQEIRAKQLFYNSEEKKNLRLLSNALENDRFRKIQKQLEEKSLPSGFNCIFYGPPGTGKTEGVLQIAKSTGREVMKVDISETKSKWFGDSEKLIKKIFTKYESLADSAGNTPILLFNEADAILSKRLDVSDSSIAQTLNTIQNILLEELENFKGIFIATTNLIDNLDPAFARRFLFKVQINLPGEEARKEIWKNKIDFLASEQYLELARRYKFSGGEIENITRKIFMHEIINAEKIDFKGIVEFCAQEKLGNTGSGFKAEKKTIVGFQKKPDEGANLAR
ncbi:AAA family ATPase [Christiangramia echinicola]|uniref:AAA family ATPase n=1 Tax=Christiangramia echinicola TaxID=279359 RepID=UPI00042A3A45|nr:ATP-binding protein [Christiangramia echinicola]